MFTKCWGDVKKDIIASSKLSKKFDTGDSSPGTVANAGIAKVDSNKTVNTKSEMILIIFLFFIFLLQFFYCFCDLIITY